MCAYWHHPVHQPRRGLYTPYAEWYFVPPSESTYKEDEALESILRLLEALEEPVDRYRMTRPFGALEGLDAPLAEIHRVLEPVKRRRALHHQRQGWGEGTGIVDGEFVSVIDAHGFRPEDLSVEVSDRNIEVKAHKEDKDKFGVMVRNLSRLVCVPEDFDIDLVHCRLTDAHELQIHVPRKKNESAPVVRQVPIKIEPAKQQKPLKEKTPEVERVVPIRMEENVLKAPEKQTQTQKQAQYNQQVQTSLTEREGASESKTEAESTSKGTGGEGDA